MADEELDEKDLKIKALEEEDRGGTKTPRVDPTNRIKGLMGGNPELN